MRRINTAPALTEEQWGAPVVWNRGVRWITEVLGKPKKVESEGRVQVGDGMGWARRVVVGPGKVDGVQRQRIEEFISA